MAPTPNNGTELRDDELRGSSLDQHPAPGGTPEQQMADDVLDREAGEGYNPNPQDQLAAHRARYEENNHKVTERLHAAGEALAAQDASISEEANRWIQKPEHQAFEEHQREHYIENDPPPFRRAGQQFQHSEAIDPGSTVDQPGMPPAQGATSPLEPDRYRKPSNT